ncbi:Histidine kinase domain-containing protein [Mycena indigotica]|uniref:histidine kinase n=1 Tax=Mycena indigotica TaxID=2126181 RepID=A0A8H6T4X0_9AGAR|nr:Histidine kinase domain-containing protein [Mycena indigotica]KAF7309972.1 Histidine kinase domain-containing protein [Mycena indigotica]
MAGKESLLPVHRPAARQLAFSSRVDRAPSSSTRHWVGRLKESPIGEPLVKLWRVCTTTLDGSLSETFKLVSSDDSDGVSSASGKSKPTALASDGDSFLDAVVVDHDDSDERPVPQQQSDSSQQGGSNSTAQHANKLYSSGLDYESHYTGGLKSWIVDRLWPRVVEFFEPRFLDHEEEFQTLSWHSNKFMAFCATLFLVLNWALYLALNSQSNAASTYGQIVYWAGFTFVTLPTPFMIALDLPKRQPVLFQAWFCVAVWYCAFSELIQMKVCHFFLVNRDCAKKDFLAMSYYSTGLPALMMFIVSKRLYNAVAQLVFFILLVALIIPDQGIYARNVVSFVVFSIFIQALHYSIEDAQRKMFLLALQLKQAYRSKHKARQAESKASFMKRRFANYIFHEVRVPLNNAVLAFQLLQSGSAFKEEFNKSTEIYALEQGLKMMKTVLNDVLDFEKMDSGHFETIAKPFPLHHSIRAILDQVEVQTHARDLILERRLDERIDEAALTVEPRRSLEPEGLWVLGSELRLHQVLTNLATNAVKYTPEGGGSIRISTEFLGITTREELPEMPPDMEIDEKYPPQNGQHLLTEKDVEAAANQSVPVVTRSDSGTILTQCLTFRLVVHDSGPGIKPSDLVEDRLFQPFVQTTVGQSTGSGTGLGLAIVKQIIRLSGGRLGVTSRRGEGSKFWIELTYPLASPAEVQAAREANTLHTSRTYTELKEKVITLSSTDSLGQMDSVQLDNSDAPNTPVTPHPSMPPRYESNPTDTPQSERETLTPTLTPSLPPAAPLTPIIPSSSEPQIVALVVDDDAITRVLSSKLLTKLGCIVHTAKDGQECVDLVLGSPPHTYDLICLDNFMPEMTGEEAVKEIRMKDRDDYIVGCTGNALTEDQDSYREAGADDVVVKPVMIHDFKRLIQTAQQRRLDRQNAAATISSLHFSSPSS